MKHLSWCAFGVGTGQIGCAAAMRIACTKVGQVSDEAEVVLMFFQVLEPRREANFAEPATFGGIKGLFGKAIPRYEADLSERRSIVEHSSFGITRVCPRERGLISKKAYTNSSS